MGYIEQLKFDPELEEFFIERSIGTDEKFERQPLSTWGLEKQFTVFIHASRKIQTSDFENPYAIINYKIPITYTIEDIESGRCVYLKLVGQSFDIPKRDNPKAKWVNLMLRDVDTGITQFAPKPNALYRDEFPYLKMDVGKAVELPTKKDVLELWRSGLCLGYYDSTFENFIV